MAWRINGKRYIEIRIQNAQSPLNQFNSLITKCTKSVRWLSASVGFLRPSVNDDGCHHDDLEQGQAAKHQGWHGRFWGGGKESRKGVKGSESREGDDEVGRGTERNWGCESGGGGIKEGVKGADRGKESRKRIEGRGQGKESRKRVGKSNLGREPRQRGKRVSLGTVSREGVEEASGKSNKGSELRSEREGVVIKHDVPLYQWFNRTSSGTQKVREMWLFNEQ